MRHSYLWVWATLLLSCAPGQALKPFQPPKNQPNNATAQPLGSDAIPVPATEEIRLPPDDPEEEEKAIEPAIIGGAYLYCDADEGKAGENPSTPMNVGCRIGNVPDTQWFSAEKNALVMNSMDDSVAIGSVTMNPQGNPYHMFFNADRSLQNMLELQAEVMLPQGRLLMTTTINPGSLRAVEQRLGPGLALYASTGTAGDWPGIDRKTWNLWMPLQIPQFITNFSSTSGPGSGPADKAKDQVQLSFDDTICTYSINSEGKKSEIKGVKPEDFVFTSCTRNWLPDQWVRVKTLNLQMISTSEVRRDRSAGVILRTGP